MEINENVELEYEIKLPQFLIDYADKTNRQDNKEGLIKSEEKSNENEGENNDEDEKKEEIVEEYDENDLLIERNSEEKEDTQIATNDESKQKEDNLKSLINIQI